MCCIVFPMHLFQRLVTTFHSSSLLFSSLADSTSNVNANANANAIDRVRVRFFEESVDDH